MITYIFLIAFLHSLVLASSLNGLAHRVYSGEISNQLLRPINLFRYLVIEDMADKIKNIVFLIFETLILFLIFRPIIILPSIIILGLFILWTLSAVILNFLISLIFGALGFWSPDTWGPRFLFFMIIDFTAGKLFPLDILPEFLQKIIYFTPFPYLSFLQIQLFLQRLNTQQIVTHSIGLLFWIGLLGGLTSWLWRKGLKSYESAGR